MADEVAGKPVAQAESLLMFFPVYDPGWPDEKRKAWIGDFAELFRMLTSRPAAVRSVEEKPLGTREAKAPADKTAQKRGRPAGADMCPGCKKMIKPVHLSIKINDRSWHAECAPEEE